MCKNMLLLEFTVLITCAFRAVRCPEALVDGCDLTTSGSSLLIPDKTDVGEWVPPSDVRHLPDPVKLFGQSWH